MSGRTPRDRHGPSRICRPVALAILGTVATIPATARAGHMILPRVLVGWSDTPCMDFVDRTADPVLELHYDIEYEDTGHTDNEVADSRTHQFLAICRQHSSQEPLPNWVAAADVDAAAAIGLVDAGSVLPSDVFETAADWDGCWSRITADDARRPITFAEAAMPVPWDTSALPAGDYLVLGYTYEPAFNRWSDRVGNVVRVFDGGDPATDIGPPAAVDDDGDATVFVGQSLAVSGCVDALPGSTMTASYAGTGPSHPDWVAFAEDVAVDGATFDIDFLAPEEAGGSSVVIRIEVTDPMDRVYTAYRYDLVSVIEGGGGGCDTGTSFFGDTGCAGSSGGTASTTSDAPTTTAGPGGGPTATSGPVDATTGGTADATGGPGQNDTGSSGCACTASPERGALPWLGLLVLLSMWRQRRVSRRSPGRARGSRPRG